MHLSEQQIAQKLGVSVSCLKPIDLNQANKGHCTEWLLLDSPGLQSDVQSRHRSPALNQSTCQSNPTAHQQLAVFSLPQLQRVDRKREAEMKRHFGAVDQKIRSSLQTKKPRVFLRQYIDKAVALWQKIV
ncbi:hypothetical protein HA075_14980 [bacterium BFN5]|nr:hypothetical protein HA075_14905 [bacterium BFN5]QJW47003.1 hypothetical protein HA075_14980 [bacterium BFN5]